MTAARRASQDNRQNIPLPFDKFLIDTMLLVGGAVLTPRLLARTLDLQIRVNLHSSHVSQHGNPLPRTFRRLQLTHAFETLGPRLAVVRRGDVTSVDSLTSGREFMLLVDVLFAD
jgi:hypothetical protein